jgi:hypothetical protein
MIHQMIVLKQKTLQFNARFEVVTAVLFKTQVGQVVPDILADGSASGSSIPRPLDPEYTDTTIL